MKRILVLLLCCLMISGCSAAAVPTETSEASENVMIANPWKNYPSLQEAEISSGLTFPMPEVIADSYTAESFRIMNGQLLEVIYRDSESEVIIRMQAGEGQDLSGVYGESESIRTFEVDGATITSMYINGGTVQLISKDGYSYSLYAPNQYWEDSNVDFLQYI